MQARAEEVAGPPQPARPSVGAGVAFWVSLLAGLAGLVLVAGTGRLGGPAIPTGWLAFPLSGLIWALLWQGRRPAAAPGRRFWASAWLALFCAPVAALVLLSTAPKLPQEAHASLAQVTQQLVGGGRRAVGWLERSLR